jgi:hypothetical protein
VLKEANIFQSSETRGSDFVFLPGWAGIGGEAQPLGTTGPGDFKEAVLPQVNKFDGFGTSRSGQRYSDPESLHTISPIGRESWNARLELA